MSEGMRLKDQPLSERPRERLVARGPDALTHAELIAILLRTGLKGANVVEIGRRLLKKYGSLHGIAMASVDDLKQEPGVGPDKAATLVAAFALARRMEAEKPLNCRFNRKASPIGDVKQPRHVTGEGWLGVFRFHRIRARARYVQNRQRLTIPHRDRTGDLLE